MLHGMIENPSSNIPRYSFIDAVENKFPNLKLMFIKSYANSIDTKSFKLDPNKLDALLNDMTEFSMAIVVLVYITGGAPPRGTELRCSFRNVSELNTRDLIFENCRLVSTPQWNKTNNLYCISLC